MIARLLPAAFWLALAGSAAALAALAGPVVWHLAGETGHVRPRAAPVEVEPVTATDLAPILDFAPFGRAVEAEAPQPDAPATETELGLTLLGVTIATDDAGSRAIIAGGDGPVESYGIGASITGAARLAEVHPGYVILDVDGRSETLSFPKSGGAAEPDGPSDGPDLRNLIPPTDSDGLAAGAGADADAVISRYRDAISIDPEGVLDGLGVSATDGGYRIGDAPSPGVAEAGFKPGDLITSVNGQKVGDIVADRLYFDEVAAAGRARVEIERDGQPIVMTFPLR